MRYQGADNVPGSPGNFPGRLVAGNPFSSDFVIRPQQGRPSAAGPTLFPLRQPGDAYIYRFTDEEKRNSIPVTFTQAQLMPGMMPMGNAGFFYGPQLGQVPPPGFLNKTVS